MFLEWITHLTDAACRRRGGDRENKDVVYDRLLPEDNMRMQAHIASLRERKQRNLVLPPVDEFDADADEDVGDDDGLPEPATASPDCLDNLEPEPEADAPPQPAPRPTVASASPPHVSAESEASSDHSDGEDGDWSEPPAVAVPSAPRPPSQRGPPSIRPASSKRSASPPPTFTPPRSPSKRSASPPPASVAPSNATGPTPEVGCIPSNEAETTAMQIERQNLLRQLDLLRLKFKQSIVPTAARSPSGNARRGRWT